MSEISKDWLEDVKQMSKVEATNEIKLLQKDSMNHMSEIEDNNRHIAIIRRIHELPEEDNDG